MCFSSIDLLNGVSINCLQTMKTGQYLVVLCALYLAKSVHTSGLPPSCSLNDFLLNGCKSDSQKNGDGCAAGSSSLGKVASCECNCIDSSSIYEVVCGSTVRDRARFS